MTFALQALPPRRRRRPAPSGEEAAVLAVARAAKRDADAAEARKLAAGVEWCRLHQVDDPDQAATWGDIPVTLAGAGAPMIAQGCVAEFAAVIGTSTNGGRVYLEHALELAYRFPNLYARIQSGEVPVWKGRQVASQSIDLTPEAATHLDLVITPVANKLSARATEKLIAQTTAEFMPALAQQRADVNATHQIVIDHRQVSFLGTSSIYGALDLADALDLDAALTRDAQELQDAGCPATLDVRRAMALGRLARGEASGRQVDLYVHLPATTNPTALVENGGAHLVTQAQVATWCGNPDVTVTIRPVIDLHDPLSAASYEVPDRIKEHLNLRDRTCVFPHCERPARGCQKDHIEPHDQGGPTETGNLGDLCQHHHNHKTHAGWTYTQLEPGVFLWRSPHGYTFLRDHLGTQELTPRPVEPPGPAPG